MEISQLVEVFEQAVLVLMLLSGGPLLASVAVGTLTSVVQAATQIQEQTLSFVPKLLAVLAVLYFLGPFFAQELLKLSSQVFNLIGGTNRGAW